MFTLVIAIFIVLCICIAITAGCMKAASMDADKDFIDWEEDLRRKADGK